MAKSSRNVVGQFARCMCVTMLATPLNAKDAILATSQHIRSV